MATVTRDFRGLKCPVPTLKMTNCLVKKEVNPGDVLEVMADCPTYEDDVKKWCAQWKKVLVRTTTEGTAKKVTVQI